MSDERDPFWTDAAALLDGATGPTMNALSQDEHSKSLRIAEWVQQHQTGILAYALRVSGMTPAEFVADLAETLGEGRTTSASTSVARAAVRVSCYRAVTVSLRDEQGNPTHPLHQLQEAGQDAMGRMLDTLHQMGLAARKREYLSWWVQ